MTVIAEIQVAPSPPGTAENPHAHVEAAIAVIDRAADQLTGIDHAGEVAAGIDQHQ